MKNLITQIDEKILERSGLREHLRNLRGLQTPSQHQKTLARINQLNRDIVLLKSRLPESLVKYE